MRGLVLANRAYETHMTDEGLQLQQGLFEQGWELAGHRYGDGCTDVRVLLSRHWPDHVFVQDKRDWDPASGCPGATHDTKFQYLSALRNSRAVVSVVVKDAGPEGTNYHQDFCKEADADAVVIYYHPMSVLKFSPWLSHYKLIRTFHSLNLADIPEFAPRDARRPLCGSGAVGSTTSDVYPLRARVSERAEEFGMMWLRHPGYKNDKGPDTPRYLSFLNSFKVSFASASAYGFSLRKIIESVACGCTVVTDLPSYDQLPEIDRALVRVKPTISNQDLKVVLSQAVATWEEEGRRKWAKKAQDFYNYQAVGERLSRALFKV